LGAGFLFSHHGAIMKIEIAPIRGFFLKKSDPRGLTFEHTTCMLSKTTERDEMFSTREVSQITGIGIPRLEVWIANGYVGPSIQKASGHGTKNIWGLVDLYDVRLFREIIDSGLSRSVANDFLSQGVLSGAIDPEDVRFVLYIREEGRITPTIIYEWDPLDVLDKFLAKNNLNPDNIFIFNFSKIVEEVDATLKKMDRRKYLRVKAEVKARFLKPKK
jgi:hypothetical protein